MTNTLKDSQSTQSEPLNASNVNTLQSPRQAKSTKKGKHSKTSKLTAKQKAFADAYVAGDATTRLNQTQSALAVYNTDANTASVIGHENIRKPIVQEYIQSLLDNNEVTPTLVIETHKRNMLQNKHLPTSQKAVEGFEQIMGITPQNDAKTTVNVALVIE